MIAEGAASSKEGSRSKVGVAVVLSNLKFTVKLVASPRLLVAVTTRACVPLGHACRGRLAVIVKASQPLREDDVRSIRVPPSRVPVSETTLVPETGVGNGSRDGDVAGDAVVRRGAGVVRQSEAASVGPLAWVTTMPAAIWLPAASMATTVKALSPEGESDSVKVGTCRWWRPQSSGLEEIGWIHRAGRRRPPRRLRVPSRVIAGPRLVRSSPAVRSCRTATVERRDGRGPDGRSQGDEGDVELLRRRWPESSEAMWSV